jgi:hypothetical protein
VRVGICPVGFSSLYPLGIEESIAYKSSDGKVIKGGETIAQGEPYEVGDVIGVVIKLAPPYKYPDPKKIIEDSSVRFFKNGKLIH